jgi:26S proteasome regulatory subunit N3
MRKSHQLHDALSTAVASLYASHHDSSDKHFLESALQKKSSAPANGNANKEGDVLPESFVYLAVLIQVQPCLSFSTNAHL